MRFIAFDLETTGFLAGVDRICEIGAVRYVNGTPDAVFSTLINPGISIPEGASRVNKITDDMVTDKPTIDRILDAFAEFCGDDVVVAHNAMFDYQFLSAAVKKYESTAPRGIVLDTLAIAKKVFPGLPNYKLGTLVQHLEIPSGTFHRAEEDASYCGLLFIKMLEKINSALEMPPIENLVALTGKEELRFPQITPEPKQLNLLGDLF